MALHPPRESVGKRARTDERLRFSKAPIRVFRVFSIAGGAQLPYTSKRRDPARLTWELRVSYAPPDAEPIEENGYLTRSVSRAF